MKLEIQLLPFKDEERRKRREYVASPGVLSFRAHNESENEMQCEPGGAEEVNLIGILLSRDRTIKTL